MLVYVDDVIGFSPDSKDLDQVFKDLKQANFDVTEEGDVCDYLGVSFERKRDGSLHLTQGKLISQILKDVNFRSNTKPLGYPAKISEILTASKDSPPHSAGWSYASVIGKLNYLEKCTRPELAYTVHQAARFSSDLRQVHTAAVHHICRYLQGTVDKGIIMKPDHTKGFEVYADADWAGLWHRDTAMDDPATARSRSGILITLAGCPVMWQSRLMSLICLSTTEAEYCTLSDAMRHVIPMINLLEEAKERGVINEELIPKIHCKAFEDNSGALELVKVPKMRPRTKHINIRYHHFRSFTDGDNPKITVHAIDTEDQLADLFTKAVRSDLFYKFRKSIMGW